jgi:N6-L-threonylcarbamoyladenine synthase
MIILGIESSCDETAAAVVKDGNELLSNIVATSMDLHAAFGGVVPEIAARSHVESIVPVIDEAVKIVGWDKIDAIAVTYGAGLGGSLLVGVMSARTLAITKNKPLYAINHVEGHVYANFLTKTNLPGYMLPSSQPEFPLLALIVSGGHSQLVLFRDHFDYTLLGQTRDDAIGEAFDKVAKITGLPYPGGPSIADAAKKGDPLKYKLPKSKLDKPYEFSFSGLKTAVLRLAQQEIGEDFTFPSHQLPDRLSESHKNDIAASFQRVAIETVVDKTVLAFEEFNPRSVVIAGGVAANQELRRQLSDRIPIDINYTDIKLCTDNGAMMATLGCFKAMHGQPTVDPYSLQIEPNLSM